MEDSLRHGKPGPRGPSQIPRSGGQSQLTLPETTTGEESGDRIQNGKRCSPLLDAGKGSGIHEVKLSLEEAY